MKKRVQGMTLFGCASLWLGVLCLLFAPLEGNAERERFIQENIMESASDFLIDDFSLNEGISAIGTQWRQFTDRVMGGESTASHSFEVIDGKRCIHLQGNVSLENRGGFVQVALPLRQNGRPFDASQFTGVRLWVKGNGENYYVHLRSSKTWLPWQYYEAPFFADNQWQKVEIPFEQFTPQSLKSALNPKKLKRLGVVGAKKAFKADIAVSRIEFYK
ncbi:MAG: CIA30 family protein [Candidatus Aminicenantes bacterium]|jgi:hypothetical protein